MVMGYTRVDGERMAWMQAVGTRQEPVSSDWRHGERGPELLRHVWSTKHPRSWRVGDYIAYYASSWGKVIGIVEMTGEPDGDGDGGQWAWQVPICPQLLVDLDVAPELADLGLHPPVDYNHLEQEEYVRVRDALAPGAGRWSPPSL
jgi:hypothetical protein